MRVYLDNNATTPLDPRVIDSMAECLKNHFGNPASLTHAWGWEAEALVEIAREQVAKSVNAKTDEIVFTSCATEGLALLIQRLASAGPCRIVASSIEHKAVLENLERLHGRGIEVDYLKVNSIGMVTAEELAGKLKKPTRLVCAIAANNEIGTLQNLEEISNLCRQHGTLLLIDQVQMLGKVPVDAARYGDFSVFSAHKIYGPKGSGAIRIRKDLFSEVKPILAGGGHEKGMRSGTLNVPGIVGFGKACSIIHAELADIESTIGSLGERFWKGIQHGISGIKLNGPATDRLPGNFSLRLPAPVAEKVIAKLAGTVALSATSACLSGEKGGSHVLRAIGLTEQEQASTIRVGIGRFNTPEEIDFACDKISETYRMVSNL